MITPEQGIVHEDLHKQTIWLICLPPGTELGTHVLHELLNRDAIVLWPPQFLDRSTVLLDVRAAEGDTRLKFFCA